MNVAAFFVGNVYTMFDCVLSCVITEAAGELGWAFSIGLVSVISALIGAIIMITLVRCKR